MKTRFTITRKPLPPPEAFQRTVHEAEILAEYTHGDLWLPARETEWRIKQVARACVHSFADKPTEMNDNRLEELRRLEDGRWLVRIAEAYLD